MSDPVRTTATLEDFEKADAYHGAPMRRCYREVTPQQWMTAHLAGRQPFKDLCIAQARSLLVTAGETVTHMSTTDLCETLWPIRFAQGEAIEVRKAMVNALLKAADQELSDCATKGPPSNKLMYGKVKRPWHWHAPKHPVAVVEDQLHEHVLNRFVLAAELADALAGCEAGALIPLFKRREIAQFILSKFDVHYHT